MALLLGLLALLSPAPAAAGLTQSGYAALASTSSADWQGLGSTVSAASGGQVQLAYAANELLPGLSTAAVQPLPLALKDLAMVAFNGRLYALGGLDAGGTPQNAVYAASSTAGGLGPWTAQAHALPAALYGEAAAVCRGRIYLSGGFGGASTGAVYSAAVSSDASLGAWRAESPLPQTLYSHAMSAWGGRLYAAGGNDGSGAAAAVYSAPISTDGSLGAWTTEANALPAPDQSLAMAAYDGALYAAGGSAGAAVYSAALNPDGSVGTWTAQGGGLPQPLQAHALSAYNGRLYVTGGQGSGGRVSTVYSAPINADGSLGAWLTEAQFLPQALSDHAAAVLNGRLYVAGGAASDGSAAAAVYCAQIDPHAVLGDWSAQGHSLPQGLTLHAMAAWNGRLYTAGGSNGSAGVYAVYSAPVGPDSNLGAWKKQTHLLPYGLYGHAMVAANGHLYATGGFDDVLGIHAGAYSAAINPDGSVGAWRTQAGLMPVALYSHAMAAWNGRLYLSGGDTGIHSETPGDYAPNGIATVYSADISTTDGTVGAMSREAQSLRQPLFGHAMTAYNGRLYVSGGFNDSDFSADGVGVYSAAVYSSSITVNGDIGVWRTEKALPQALYGHAMAVLGGRLCVLGGANDNGPQSKVYSAAISSDGSLGPWRTQTQGLPQTLYYAPAAVWDGALYLSGGTRVLHDAQTAVYSSGVSTYAAAGTYFNALDLGASGSLGSLAWSDTLNGGTLNVSISTASAAGAFGPWTQAANAATVDLPSVRYLRYRVDMSPSAAGATPRFTSLTVTPITPGTPGTPAGTAVSSSSIRWTWTKAKDASFYNVYPASDPATLLCSTPSASFLQVGLDSNTAYGIEVAAFKSGVQGPLTRAATAYTLAATPQTLSPVAVDITSVTVSWDADDYPPGTRFSISHWKVHGATANTTAEGSPAAVSGLAPATTYYFNIRALNQKGVPSAFAADVEFSTRTLPRKPAAIEKLAAEGAAADSIQWTWTPNAGPAAADDYYVYPQDGVERTTTTALFLATGYASPNSPHSVKVQAHNASGLGPLTKAVTGYTLAAVPTGFAPYWVATTSMAFQWGQNGNPSADPKTPYIISYWLAATGKSTATATFYASPGTIKGLHANTTYYINIQAENAQGVKTAFSGQLQYLKTRVSNSVASVKVVVGPVYSGKAVNLAGTPNPFAFGLKLPALRRAPGTSLATTGTIFTLELPPGADGEGHFKIYTRSGSLVRDMSLGELKGGSAYFIDWDGKDAHYVGVAPGPYYGIFTIDGSRLNALIKLTVRTR